ncbi:MAG: hypothetical protein ABIB55_00230 [Candidatus Nealsonbacteria bacterium]
MRWVFAALFWLAAVIFPMFMITASDTTVKSVDISAIRAEEIVAGTNVIKIKPDFDSRVSSFLGNSYDLVLVGVNGSKMVYLGEADDQWYRAEEELGLGSTQEVVDVRINNQTLAVTCAKHTSTTVFFSIFTFLIFGLIGLFIAIK